MRRGFTILELLVASLLLGMLTTILTMIFNQSSIAWRTGTAMVADLDDIRDNLAELREESDNAFIWKGQVHRIVGLWKENGDLNDRACDGTDSGIESDPKWNANMLKNRLSSPNAAWSAGQNVFNVGAGDRGNSGKTYLVNVMSAGPNKEFGDWDDIWSFPDDFE